MSGWRARLAVLAVFALGFVGGGAAMHLYRVQLERRIINSPEPVVQLAITGLDRELSLSDDQEREVRSALLDARQQFLTSHPDLMSDFAAVFEKTQARISTILTPEQRLKYERIVAERRRMLQDVQRSVQPPPP